MASDLFRTVGRPPRQFTGTIVRELDSTDMILLDAPREPAVSALKAIRERHHLLARRLADGIKITEAAIECGWSTSRVSILQTDPAFKELVEFYRKTEVLPAYRGMHERLAELSLDAADELAARLEAEPEKISVGQLMEVVKLGADRTGFGPQSSSMNLNVNVDMASRLQKARERVAQRQLEQDI